MTDYGGDLTRRRFLGVSASSLAALSTLKTPSALRFLVLGGTGFIGPHMVQAALDRGHDVTLFNRGRSNTHLFPDIERIVGDRAGPLDGLAGRSWDVVIDNSGYFASHVRASAEALKGSVGHYLYTSTIDAYRDFRVVGLDETYPLAEWTGEQPENPGQYYGPIKAECERVVREIYPDSSTQVRPGWIAGPGDNNHLLTYWVVRIDRGGEVLAPGVAGDHMQVTDARDLAQWYIHLAEQRITGAFNAVGPVMSWGDTLEGIRRATGSSASFTWVDADFLLERDVKPWTDIPLWWPARNDWGPRSFGGIIGGEGAFAIDGSRAREHGLSHRSLADTVTSTLAWYDENFDDWPEADRPGFARDQERALLREWTARSP